MIKVKEMSKLLGVDRSFLHYYDEIGIIVPEKNDKNYRFYSNNDLMALASSKYYRGLDMNLKQLSEMILISDGEKKLDIMTEQKKQLAKKAELYNDLSTVAGFAIGAYKNAYNSSISMVESPEFEFIQMLDESGVIQKENDIREDILDSFPFVSYTYYFPVNSLIDEENFSYKIGIATIPYYRRKYEIELTSDALRHSSCKAILFPLEIGQDIKYRDFDALRTYANDNNIKLTGEAIAYCVFSNYKIENGHLKLIVYCMVE